MSKRVKSERVREGLVKDSKLVVTHIPAGKTLNIKATAAPFLKCLKLTQKRKDFGGSGDFSSGCLHVLLLQIDRIYSAN